MRKVCWPYNFSPGSEDFLAYMRYRAKKLQQQEYVVTLVEQDQRGIVKYITFESLQRFEELDICNISHTPKNVLNIILRCPVNIALNNTCKNKNNSIQLASAGKQLQKNRKATTLSGP